MDRPFCHGLALGAPPLPRRRAPPKKKSHDAGVHGRSDNCAPRRVECWLAPSCTISGAPDVTWLLDKPDKKFLLAVAAFPRAHFPLPTHPPPARPCTTVGCVWIYVASPPPVLTWTSGEASIAPQGPRSLRQPCRVWVASIVLKPPLSSLISSLPPLTNPTGPPRPWSFCLPVCLPPFVQNVLRQSCLAVSPFKQSLVGI